MPESSQNNRFSSNDSLGETTSWQPPLGFQHPLVTANPLGQSFLSPKFLSPLGAQPLGGGNPLGASAQGLPDYNLSENFFQDSPSLAESQLSLNPPEAPVMAAAIPTVGMDSTPVNLQRYPGEIPTAHEPEQNPIPAAPDSLSEVDNLPVGHDAQATTEKLEVAAEPHEQLGASDTAPLNPTVVQPKLATKPLLQREIAIPELPEAVEPIREPSVSESESSVQIPEVTEEPSAIANANPSVMRSADLSNVPPPQTSPVAPLPSLPADHLSDIEPIVSSQAELSPVHAIEPADTDQNTQDVPSVPVQRQEDIASPPPLVESLPLPEPAAIDAPANAVLDTPDTQLISETTPIAMQAEAATQTNIPQPVVQLLPEREAIDASANAVIETPDTQLISETAPTVMQAEGLTQTNIPQPVVQPFPEQEAINTAQNTVIETPATQLLSQTAPTVMKAEEVRQEVQQGAFLVEDTGEEVQPEESSSATPLPTSDAASTPSAISMNLLQRSTTADESSEGEAAPESLSAPVESTAQLPELVIEKTTVTRTADITSPTTPEESSIQRQPLPEIEETAADAGAHSDITSSTTPEESSIQRQPLPEIEETVPDASAHSDITSLTTPEESSI